MNEVDCHLYRLHIDNVIRNNINTLYNGYPRGLGEHSILLSDISRLVSPYSFVYAGVGHINIIASSKQNACLTPEEMLSHLNDLFYTSLVYYKLPYTITFTPDRNQFGIVYGIRMIEVDVMDIADELVEALLI